MKKIALIICSIILGLVVYYFYPEHQLKEGQIANKIVINKAKHELLLYSNESLIASYKVSLSNKGLAKKKKEGDNLTPEGVFRAKKCLQLNSIKQLVLVSGKIVVKLEFMVKNIVGLVNFSGGMIGPKDVLPSLMMKLMKSITQ